MIWSPTAVHNKPWSPSNAYASTAVSCGIDSHCACTTRFSSDGRTLYMANIGRWDEDAVHATPLALLPEMTVNIESYGKYKASADTRWWMFPQKVIVPSSSKFSLKLPIPLSWNNTINHMVPASGSGVKLEDRWVGSINPQGIIPWCVRWRVVSTCFALGWGSGKSSKNFISSRSGV